MLTVEMGGGGSESLYCQKISKVHFLLFFTVNYENSDMSAVI